MPRSINPDPIMQSLNHEVWAYVSINTIGKSLSAAPLIVEEHKTVDSKLQWVPQDSGKLVDLIARPNDVETFDILLWRLVMTLITGDGYLIRDDETEALYHAHPKYIKAIVSESEGIVGWELGRGTNMVPLDLEQVIHIPMPNPMNEFYGFSPLQPVKQQVLLNYNYLRYIHSFFKNGALPAGVLESDAPQPQPDELADHRKSWNTIFEGVEKAHKVAFLFRGVKYKQLSPPLSELMVDTIYKMPREAILATFGMPPVLAGIFEYANYANAKEQVRIFWQNCILPMQRLIAGCLNIQLVPHFGDNLRVRFDTSKIEALREDQEKKAKTNVILVTGGIFTANEVRIEEYGKEPLDGGNELRQPAVPLLGNDNSGGTEGRGQTPSPGLRCVKDDNPRDIKKQEHKARVTSAEKSLERIVRKFFDEQLDRLMDRLKEISIDGKFISALLYSWLLKGGADDDVDRLFDIVAENALLYEVTDGLVRQSVHDAGTRAMREVRVDLGFSVDNPQVLGMIENFHNRSSLINNTTYDKIKDILKATYENGETLADAEKRIRGFYSEQSKMRATRMAKTEMNGMLNGGAVEGYTQAGVEKLEWMSAFLADSRQEHMDADGQIIDIGGKFQVGGDLLAFPGDPSGSPGNTINCYCSVNPV